LYGIQIAKNVQCSECHAIPTQFGSAGHIDETTRAEVIFGVYENSGDSTATYNFEKTTCENSYCHGNFAYDPGSGVLIVGNNFAPDWTVVDGSQGACGTCHGQYNDEGEFVTPLPVGHPGSFLITDCWNCHTSVVDQQGNIIDTDKHINGQANVFGQ
jgi:predicted CxxxxCH...CXXCH cytochrome family protein